MAALLHLVAMQPSRAEIRIRDLARCHGPLCSMGPAGDAITAGSCGWITGLSSAQTNNPNYILNLQYMRSLETTVTHSPSLLPEVCPSTSCSFCVIFGLFSHKVLLCPLISLTLPIRFLSMLVTERLQEEEENKDLSNFKINKGFFSHQSILQCRILFSPVFVFVSFYVFVFFFFNLHRSVNSTNYVLVAVTHL